MKLEQVELPVSNQLLFDYWSGSEKLQPFYQYEFNDYSFTTRLDYLKSRYTNNEELSNIIRSYMEPLGISEKVEENLKHLEKGAVAVVGGQQAGILTGPLYSVHKAITVILLSKEQSEKLGEKVVPIFWIAGEDHDLEEINHTFTIHNGIPKKQVYDKRSSKKTMASATKIQKDELINLIESIFNDYGETEYTQDLFKFVLHQIEQSDTFTDLFARIMNHLFKNEGLLMIDAAFTPFRKFESSFFVKIIEQNEGISKVVVEKEQLLDKEGYGKPISATIENANLFYVQDGERFLLERTANGYQNSNGLFKFTKEQLLDIAKTSPENLSNNVVTRPLIQEMAIPVLAFVGGPGELAYWATLKDAFELLDLQMPILAPRLNITLLTRKVNQLLLDYELTIAQVMDGSAQSLKEKFINSVQDVEAKKQIAELKGLLNEQYEKLAVHLTEQQIKLLPIINKNKKYHEMQLEYLNKKIEQEVLAKHDKTIGQFNLLNAEIYPNENLQERVYNPFQYLNVYGIDLINDLCKLPMTISNKHYIVKL
ncbi:bacillithiol biosynthesis cysteine-adding enzyme BshC [Lysinibacillus telephonicus]|uniref:Putative cysteine ligase BshC n=1 Tax=Lysinibacillus telephonicus TaxID=1714840 RepID=A0A3S0J5A8_9BACI|nr:bacillithiol biosynthesis cysteine-adding enzyme BshC [Lysinibacillus telephonicus]RTQ95400.1 bacillithiol biosynthesis cysteine-adding enzyme BshC [Lysinibacillus telephonicus]